MAEQKKSTIKVETGSDQALLAMLQSVATLRFEETHPSDWVMNRVDTLIGYAHAMGIEDIPDIGYERQSVTGITPEDRARATQNHRNFFILQGKIMGAIKKELSELDEKKLIVLASMGTTQTPIETG